VELQEQGLFQNSQEKRTELLHKKLTTGPKTDVVSRSQTLYLGNNLAQPDPR